MPPRPRAAGTWSATDDELWPVASLPDVATDLRLAVPGEDADRVVVHLVGRTLDGATTGPGDLDLPERSGGRDLAGRHR
jgi:hypothetical protein